MKLPVVLERYRLDIDNEIRSIVECHKTPLYDMMRYHLGWIDGNGNCVTNNSGKALRPSLCLFSCEAVGGDFHRALLTAAALELVHNFSLIHDDIQDDDRERHHRPTVWAIWGKPQAINAGTAMRILASYALTNSEICGIDLQKQLRLHKRLDEISLKLIEGQYLDISYENRFDIKVKDYLTMIELKTAQLISGSMELGVFLGTEDEELVNTFREIGENLGLAFQIKDDILGVWGKQEETGKPSGSDIRRHKKSFPIVYALENTNETLKNELVNIYKCDNMSESNISRVMEIFEEVGARKNAQNAVETWCAKVEDRFGRLEMCQRVKGDMNDLIEFIADRNY